MRLHPLPLLAILALTGCAATVPPPAPGKAQCAVCRATGDLACVNFPLTPDTPTLTTPDGVVHAFCSHDCRDAFAHRPDRYPDAR